LIKPLPTDIANEMKRDALIIQGNWKRMKSKIKRDGKKAAKSILKKYGHDYFRKIGKIGGKNQKTYWTRERSLKQCNYGRLGGLKRVMRTKYFNRQEKHVFEENKRLDLKFKSNYFLDNELNFDFVYFKNGNIIGVEETTLNPFRGLASFIEKRSKIEKEIPFIVTFKKSYPQIVSFLLKMNIIPLNLNQRRLFIKKILNPKSRNKIKEKIKDIIKQKIDNSKIFSYVNATRELETPYDKYEKIIHRVLNILRLSPMGKTLIETRDGFHFVPDDMISINDKKIAFLVSHSSSRGSLFYTFYKDSTYGVLFKNTLKERIYTFSIIFDFSGTVSAYGNNKPRELWLKYCDFKLVVNNKNLKKLPSLIKSTLGS